MATATKKVDWRQARKQEDAGGREILARGTRSSEGNDGSFANLDLLTPEPTKRRSAIMQQLEANRKMYLTLHGFGGRPISPEMRDRLKGLFGGGK